MTVQQLSDQFDVLYNNITSNQAPGLNEYEKSVFLTKAQDELVKDYFNPKSNAKQEGFDDSPKRQADFSTLIKHESKAGSTSSNSFDSRSYVYNMPDVFITLNEQLVYNSQPVVVVPISYGEYDRLMAKPYKYPPKNQAWRLITDCGPSSSITPGIASVAINPTHGWYTGKKIGFTTNSTDKEIRLSVYLTDLTEQSVVYTDSYDDYVEIEMRIRTDTSFHDYKEQYLDGSNIWSYISSLEWPDDYSDDSEEVHGRWDDRDAMLDDNQSIGIAECNAKATSSSTGSAGTQVEIIGRFDSAPTYKIRYVKRPRPIRLAEFDTQTYGVTLGSDGTAAQTSELPEHLHEEILQRAVELAKVAWEGNVQTVVEAGNRSE